MQGVGGSVQNSGFGSEGVGARVVGSGRGVQGFWVWVSPDT